MDDILLDDSNADSLEKKVFGEIQRILTGWGLQIVPENLQKGDPIIVKAD